MVSRLLVACAEEASCETTRTPRQSRTERRFAVRRRTSSRRMSSRKTTTKKTSTTLTTAWTKTKTLEDVRSVRLSSRTIVAAVRLKADTTYGDGQVRGTDYVPWPYRVTLERSTPFALRSA